MFSSPLVSASALRDLLGSVVVLDARAGPDAASDYARGHVRGAIRVDLEQDLSAPDDPRVGGRHPVPPLESWLLRLGAWGIGPDSAVVIYDATSGAMAAARAWWMLRAVGHQRVAVVDGGLPALSSAGVPIVPGEASPAMQLPPYPTSCDGWPTVDEAWVTRVHRDPEWSLIDARAPERYRGETEPLDPVAGHIPGANNLYWKSQLLPDGRFAPPSDRLELYARARGNASPDRVICYCGSGVTACHVILGMEAAGVAGAQLYAGSWSEWCRRHPPSHEAK